MTAVEAWKAIADFPGYEVSSQGRVRRTAPGRGTRAGTVLRPRALARGHCYVNLRREGRPHSCYVHRLVAAAFIGEPPSEGHTHVAHWDGDARNNRVENLRWATPAENNADSVRLGRSARPTGTRSGRAKLSAEDVRAIRRLGGDGESQRHIAVKFGVTHQVIGTVLRGTAYREVV